METKLNMAGTTLVNGSRIASLSPHEFTCDDGTVVPLRHLS